MILKKLLGDIIESLGFATRQQIEVALSKQREMFSAKTVPEQVQRPQLIAQARSAMIDEEAPLLGKILMDMQILTQDQVQQALNIQGGIFEIYKSLGSQKLGTIVEIGSVVNSTLNLSEVLTLIMRHANRLTNSVASTLMLLDEATGELVFSVPTGPKADKLTDVRIPRGKGIAGWVVEHERYALISDVKSDKRFYPKIDHDCGFETQTILCVPMKVKNNLIGVLEVINKTDGTAFTEEDALLLGIFASQTSMAIENARLYGELKHRWQTEKHLRHQLAESEKFQALGQMASGIAHDFNNILGAIMGYTEMTLYHSPNPEDAHQNLNEVLKASRRARDLVKQILAFASKSDIQRKPANLVAIVDEAINLLRASFPSTIDIRKAYRIESGTIMADTTQIHQVVVNLGTNALHSMQTKGGALTVKISRVDGQGIENSHRPAGVSESYLKLSIADTGHGMSPDMIERIFDPYFTTKEKGMGTGMGLAVVQGIVKSHGGSIMVTSEPGRGALFEILFPQLKQEPVNKTDSLPDLPTGDESVLFIDDEEPLAILGRKMLESLGYRVMTTTSPDEALAAFRRQQDRFDLVITDMTMPNMTGEQLAHEFMRQRPDLPVILCTGFSERMSQVQATDMGFSGFLMKPLAIRDLSVTIRKALDKPMPAPKP